MSHCFFCSANSLKSKDPSFYHPKLHRKAAKSAHLRSWNQHVWHISLKNDWNDFQIVINECFNGLIIELSYRCTSWLKKFYFPPYRQLFNTFFLLFRSSRNVARTCPSCRTASSCPSQYESWTSTCAACPVRRSRSWSSAGAPWRTGATPLAAGSNGFPSAKPWNSRRWSSRGRWRGSGRRTPAWGKSWRGSARAWLRSRGSPGAWRPEGATCWLRPLASTPPQLSPSWRVHHSLSNRENTSRPRRSFWNQTGGGGGTHTLQCKTHTHTHTLTIHKCRENRKTTIIVGKY